MENWKTYTFGPIGAGRAIPCKDGEFVTVADAQATVEALQRERDEAKKMEAVQKEVADNQTWHVRELRTALDAEREKVRTVEHELARIVKRNQGGYIGDRIAIDKCLTIIRTLPATTPAGQRWTRRKPTIEGWYWFRDNKKDPPDVHWLSLIDGKLRVFTMSNENCVEHIDDYTGEWQGPLTPNEATA
jgi:hypothetical protein